MSDITIGRYRDPESTGYAGWIEGTDTTGNRWITYLDRAGAPTVHWAHREPDGAVLGAPTALSPAGQI